LLRVGKGAHGGHRHELVSTNAAGKNLVCAACGIEIPPARRRLQQRNREGKTLGSDVEQFAAAVDLSPSIHRFVCGDELREGVSVLDRISREQDFLRVWAEDRQ